MKTENLHSPARRELYKNELDKDQRREAVWTVITWTEDTGTPLDSPPTTHATDPATATPARATGSGSCATRRTLAVVASKDQMSGTVVVE